MIKNDKDNKDNKETKRAKVIRLVGEQDYKKALSIAKDFVRDFNYEERRIIQIAYETLSGKESFYKMMKIDTEEMVIKAKKLLDEYGK